jgi:hypothetical protein
VAPKDIFMLDVYTKEPGKSHGEVVDRFFVGRSKAQELMRALDKVYPSDKFSQGLQPSSAAYKPRKGEPSYKEWMAGKRPGFCRGEAGGRAGGFFKRWGCAVAITGTGCAAGGW